jgi:hypothetical protein
VTELHKRLLFAGVTFVVAGGIWTLQGLDYIEGSPMTGEPFWVKAGLAVVVVGALILALGLRSRSSPNG